MYKLILILIFVLATESTICVDRFWIQSIISHVFTSPKQSGYNTVIIYSIICCLSGFSFRVVNERRKASISITAWLYDHSLLRVRRDSENDWTASCNNIDFLGGHMLYAFMPWRAPSIVSRSFYRFCLVTVALISPPHRRRSRRGAMYWKSMWSSNSTAKR